MKFDMTDLRYFRSDRYINKDGTFDDYSDLPRPFATIGMIKRGKWLYEENFANSDEKRQGVVSAGELLYIPQGSTYSATWRADGSGMSECVSLHFELSGGFFNSRRTNIQKLTAPDSTGADFESILRLYRDPRSADEKESFKKQAVILSCLYDLISRLTDQIAVGADNTDPHLLPALDYLQAHPTDHISVAELAAMCYISESYFYVLFRNSVGVPYTEYKNSLVIAKAERLLIERPELSIEEISAKLGFSSSAYFRRVFQRFLGCSPREYRVSHRI